MWSVWATQPTVGHHRSYLQLTTINGNHTYFLKCSQLLSQHVVHGFIVIVMNILHLFDPIQVERNSWIYIRKTRFGATWSEWRDSIQIPIVVNFALQRTTRVTLWNWRYKTKFIFKLKKTKLIYTYMTSSFSTFVGSGTQVTLSDVDSKLVKICFVANRIVIHLNANFLQYLRSSFVCISKYKLFISYNWMFKEIKLISTKLTVVKFAPSCRNTFLLIKIDGRVDWWHANWLYMFGYLYMFL